MSDDKKYYWIKLKMDFFNMEEIDFLLSQKNGCEYVVLYQMLCLMSANTNGRLQKKIGEMIVPYTIDKIVRDTKYFDVDTVTVALELYKRLGLVYYEGQNGTLVIPGAVAMVGKGSASKEAEKKANQRANKRLKASGILPELPQGTNGGTKCPSEKGTKCPTEYKSIRDLEYKSNRDIDIKSIEGDISEDKPPKTAPKEPKRKHGEYNNVLLTDRELEKLQHEYPDWQNRIERLSSYIASTGKSYKSHYATIRNWARRDAEEQAEKAAWKQSQQQQTSNPFLDMLRDEEERRQTYEQN